MIKIQLEVTPAQMVDIAAVMAGTYSKQCPGDCGANAKQIADLDAATQSREQNNEGDTVGGDCADSLNHTPESHKQKDAETLDKVMVSTADKMRAEAGDDVPPPPATNETVVKHEDVTVTTTTDSNGDTQKIVTEPTGVTLDSAGLPWDVRIHAATKTTKADGTWKRKVRVADELVAEVEAELRAALTAVPPADDVPPPPANDPAAALAAATNDVPPPPVTGSSPTKFAEILPLVAAAKANGTISDDQIAVAVAGLGLGKFGELAVRPDLIPKFAKALGV